MRYGSQREMLTCFGCFVANLGAFLVLFTGAVVTPKLTNIRYNNSIYGNLKSHLNCIEEAIHFVALCKTIATVG